MYFYKPTTPFELIGGKGGILPALGLLENYKKFTTNFLSENFGLIVGDKEIQDDAKPIKYLMKSFPLTNQISSYLPLFYPVQNYSDSIYYLPSNKLAYHR